jgi:hypothetical protein
MAWPVPTVAHLFIKDRRTAMPRGSKAAYSSKQRREARHIEESYEKRGVSSKEAARRAWATVNKQTGGAAGKKASAKKSTASTKKASSTKKTHSDKAGTSKATTRTSAKNKASTTKRDAMKSAAAKATRRHSTTSRKRS